MTESRAITDTGPLIHLDELACLDLLDDFKPLIIPQLVLAEALHRPPNLALPTPAVVIEAITPHPSPR